MEFKRINAYNELSPKAAQVYSVSDFYITKSGATYRIELNKQVQFEGTIEDVNKWFEDAEDDN